jgi:hypothetical protein
MSIAGKRTRPTGGNRGLLSGSGRTINGVFEITRQSTTILTTERHAPAPVLISGGTHILLDPGTRTGTFKTVEIVTSGGGELAIDHTSGTAAVVPYP